jgi:hypothetical protein
VRGGEPEDEAFEIASCQKRHSENFCFCNGLAEGPRIGPRAGKPLFLHAVESVP